MGVGNKFYAVKRYGRTQDCTSLEDVKINDDFITLFPYYPKISPCGLSGMQLDTLTPSHHLTSNIGTGNNATSVEGFKQSKYWTPGNSCVFRNETLGLIIIKFVCQLFKT